MTLGQRIADHRSRLRLSQANLAEKLNISRQSVSKWETDASVPEVGKLIELSRLFEITLDELMTGEVASKPETEMPIKSTSTQKIIGYILLIVGILATILGLFIGVILFLGVYLIVCGIIVLRSKRNPALKIAWATLFILLLPLRMFTSISLELIFVPYAYSGMMTSQLIVAYVFWFAVILWTFFAMKSECFKNRKYLAVGYGAVLVVCTNWQSVLYWVVNIEQISNLALTGWLRIGMSVIVTIVAIVLIIKNKVAK